MLTRMLQAAAILLAGTAAAQTPYPSHTMTMVVAFNAGGSTDLIARVLAQHMGSVLGQTIIIENKGGADGAIGTAAVARAAPDGYTLILSTTSTHVINPLLYKNISYNPATDFQPISLVAQSPNILVSSLKFDAKSVADIIARARAAPGTLNVATGATMHLLNAAMFKSMAGVNWVDVPYKGSGPALNDLFSGQIDLMCADTSATAPQVRGGNIKAYAVMSKTRWPGAPDIPTVDEVGLPGLYVSFWQGLWAPRATPDAIVDRLASAMAEVSKDPDFIAKTALIGIVPTARGPTDFAAFIKSEVETNSELLKEAGYKPD